MLWESDVEDGVVVVVVRNGSTQELRRARAETLLTSPLSMQDATLCKVTLPQSMQQSEDDGHMFKVPSPAQTSRNDR